MAGLEGEKPPIGRIVSGAGDRLVFGTRDALIGQIAPAALGVGEAVEAVFVLGAGAVGIRFEVFESEDLYRKFS